ncbi:condensation domain-containing protein [Phytohabitans houttuyneae]|uniref:Condensation domain-containing protein n=1 Tax=Phytohabitans houttuyneae TaxID=1076126 RepID=A0A6V8KJE6_9ACTN|nr:condensation domain-containing protein [Phytohabitans houttuyneae]GFJ82568.1 hypothetical protein Phou_067480 [Phytohabitans houttuyneae]
MTGDVRALSAGQRAMWALHTIAPESATSNVVTAAIAAPALDTGILRAAVGAVRQRHDLLRSTFHAADPGPVRAVSPPGPGAVEVRDVGAVDDPRLLALVREVGAAPLRLAEDGPARIVLLRRPHDCALVVVVHHIATDGLSQWVLWRDLSEAYRTIHGGGTVDWAPLPAYDDFVAKERAMLDGPRGAELRAHWERTAAGATAATLPTDRPRPARRSYRGAAVSRPVPDRLAERVRARAASAGVTPFSVLLGVYEGLLYRYTGQAEFTIGCPVSLRRGRALREAVGLLVNLVVLRSSFTPATTFAEAFAAAQRQVSGGLAHAAYPFALVQPPGPDREPLVRATFTMLARQPGDTLSDGDHGFAGHHMRRLSMPWDEGQFDVAATVREGLDRSLSVELSYDTDLFDAPTVDRLLGHYLGLLGAACAAPDRPVSRASMVDEAERRALLALGSAV